LAHFALLQRKNLEKEGEFCSDMRGAGEIVKGPIEINRPFYDKLEGGYICKV
jgi:hypothetical protein